MRVLLDEGISHRLRGDLAGHDVMSVQFMGWRQKSNGELLALARGVFDVVITADQTFRGELEAPPYLALIVLIAGDTGGAALQPCVPRILHALSTIRPGQVVQIDCST